jgi:hypothetical protein
MNTMSKKISLCKQARDHASFLLNLAADLEASGTVETAKDCAKASAIIRALLERLEKIDAAHGKMGRILMGLE